MAKDKEDTTNDEGKKPESQMEVIPPSEAYARTAEAKSLEWMNPKRWQVMQAMANTFISSGAVPESIKNAAQMIMVFQKGYEIGLQPVESLESLYIVNGKITLWGEAVIALIMVAGHKVEWAADCDDEKASVTITRKDNGQSMTGTFTMEKARKRGLLKTSKGNDSIFWNKFPENMLKFKALGSIARFIVPDALHGMKIKEELEADGEIELLDAGGTTPITKSKAVPKVAEAAAEAVDNETHSSLAEELNKPQVSEADRAETRAAQLDTMGFKYIAKRQAFVRNTESGQDVVNRRALLESSDEEWEQIVDSINADQPINEEKEDGK